MSDLWVPDSLPREMHQQLSKMATPAHVAQTCTADLPPDAQWKPAAHLDIVNRAVVEACTSNHQDFLDFEISVRHGKSLLLSGFLPVWYLGLFPDRRVILLAFNEDKAAEWGEFTRDVFAEWGPSLFGLTVDTKTASKTLWKVKGRRGELLAAGLGGTITGKGGDLIVIDDPIKNREEADSPTMRLKMVTSYYSNVRTRMAEHGTVVLAMARWHEADLAGEVVRADDENADQWKTIRFPAIAEAPPGEDPEEWVDDIGRKEGDALWPEKWSLETMRRVEATLMRDDPQAWHSLYQQNPTAREGKDFKIEKWIIAPHVDRHGLRLVRFWDLAATDSKQSDWTVGLLVGMDNDSVTYVLDEQRFRLDPGPLEERIKMIAKLDGMEVPVRLEQERAGAGKMVTAQFVRLLTGFDVDGTRPEGDKRVRARPVAAQQNKGRVVLEQAEWNHDFIEEFRVFPNARFDDRVDALSGGFQHLVGIGPSYVETEVQFDTPLARMYGQVQDNNGIMPGLAGLAQARRLVRR